MTTEQKYRLALLQLQAYSDNECIIIEGVSINIQDELDSLPVEVKTKKAGFEIYTSDPITGTTGWEIQFVEVLGVNTTKEAREKLKTFPHFDVVILCDYLVEMEVEDYEFLENDVHFIKR